MNDSALKEFCIWAREELRSQVAQRLQLYGITAQGYGDASANVIGARVLTEDEVRQRKELIDKFLSGSEEGYEQRYEALVERAAYTWFNRLAAIRYMEVNGLLPSGVRMLSAADGSFAPQALRMAGDIDIAGVERMQVARLVADGDDEKLFRYLLLAQCAELAEAMPDVFEPIGSAMELLLTDGLLRSGSVVERLVTAIPESDWKEGVEIVGWMYQYYNAQRKDDVFASFKKGKKAEVDAIAPATQLFTPHWIVRYLVENSLGRLWMRSHPDSSLVDSMPYYIPDDPSTCHFERSEAESRNLPLTPESITVVDPACGSGHILTYCFDLLMKIYAEAGYTARDAVQSVLENNLSGIEIDPRAAELASFALAMKACEYDPRYLSRQNRAVPQVTCLAPVQIDQQELDASIPYLADRAKLLDAMKHINECGSLFVPSPEDLAALDRASEELGRRLESGDLLAYALNTAVGQMKANCEPLARSHDVVVANPPYMGSKNMDKWLSDWTKKNYPDVKGDLFSCFIERNLGLAKEGGQLGFMTPYVWMFIGSYEKLRREILSDATITSLVQLEYSGFAGATVPICTFTLQKGQVSGYLGGYVRLSDFVGADNQGPKTLEAIANPDCGWFYRRDDDAFSAIPGTPIAYWIPKKIISAYHSGLTFKTEGHPKVGMQTSNNDKFLRIWWEISNQGFEKCTPNPIWIKYLKGGDYRKWYGNLWYLLHYNGNPDYILQQPHAKVQSLDYLKKCKCTWTDLTSGEPSFRIAPIDSFYDISGHCFLPPENSLHFLLAYSNTSIVAMMKKMFNSSFHFQVGDLEKIAIPYVDSIARTAIESIADSCVSLSKSDWDSFETSWDFKRHPMVGD